jgi:Fe-S-cluster containining protein
MTPGAAGDSLDIHFDCTQCGDCCRNLKIPLTVSEAVAWLDRGHQVQIICEGAPWPAEFPAEDLRAAHLKRRSFAARSGAMPARVVVILAANVVGDCPNLQPDSRCGIYEERPLVCRIYPAEINPFIELVPGNKNCPPEAWGTRLPLLMRNGKLVSSEIHAAIQQSRDTDACEVHIKSRVCAALKFNDTAVVREGFVLYSPPHPELRQALAAAIAAVDEPVTEPQWRFVSDRSKTLEYLEQQGAVACHSLDSGAVPYTYLSLKRLTDAAEAG